MVLADRGRVWRFGVQLVIDSSNILYPARGRYVLDWETMNKLCEQNRDFEKFLQDVKIDFESKRIHRSEFDEVVKDIRGYVREKLRIEPEA